MKQKHCRTNLLHISTEGFDTPDVSGIVAPEVTVDQAAFEAWKQSNVIAQKQDGLFAIGVKVNIGDFYTKEARLLADLIRDYAGDELRFSLRQNILIRHVREDLLPFFFQELGKLGMARFRL